MKLTKNFTIICYLFLIAISNITSAHVSMKSQSRGKALSRTKGFINKVLDFFKGIGQAIVGGNKALQDNFLKLFGCFKGKSATVKAAGKGSTMDTTYKYVNLVADKIVVGIKFIFSAPKAILNFLCQYRKKIVLYISYLFMGEQKAKYRRMLENGQALSLKQLRKYREAGIFTSIKNFGSKGFNFMKKGFKKVYGGIKWVGGKTWNLIWKKIGPFLMKYWKYIKQAIVALKDLFLGPDSFLVKIVECGKEITAKAWDALKSFWEKLKQRWARFQQIYRLSTFYKVLYFGDFVFASVCNDKLSADIIAAAKKQQEADKNKNIHDEIKYNGEVTGNLMKLANSFEKQSGISKEIDAAIKKLPFMKG